MSNIYYLDKYRQVASFDKAKYSYFITRMNKHQLFNEMIAFQRQRSEQGKLTLDLILKGLILFPTLYKVAATPEMQLLAASYAAHLQHELARLTGDSSA